MGIRGNILLTISASLLVWQGQGAMIGTKQSTVRTKQETEALHAKYAKFYYDPAVGEQQGKDFSYETMERVDLKDFEPLAVCNDGTSAAYAWKKSPTGSNRWLIYLAGGGMCYDHDSCVERAKGGEPPKWKQISSEYQPKQFTGEGTGGIFSPDPKESPMWDANKVFLHHCTSDYHTGAVGGPDHAAKKFGMYFRGQSVVTATIRHLIEKQGLGSGTQNKTVVFGGVSAGGLGASLFADKVAEMVKPYNAKVLGFFDGAMYFDTPSMKPSVIPLHDRVRQLLQNWNASALSPPTCMNEFDKENQWKCLFPQYFFKQIKTPFMFVMDQFDDYHMDMNSGVYARAKFDEQTMNYCMNFGKISNDYYHNFDIKKQGQQTMIWAPRCGKHAYSNYAGFTINKIGGVTQAQAFTEALEAVESGKDLNKKYIEDCEGLRCGTECFAK